MKIFFTLFLFSRVALATTFGPIALVNQAENAQYIAEGHIHGSSVQAEPASKLAYTYYNFTLLAQHKGTGLPSEFLIRSPGGELNGIGNQVAGAATFAVPEDAIVYLKDTNEDGVKEVVGLSSGKFTEVNDSGKTLLVNGLGFPVTGASGERLSSKDFTDLIYRAVHGQATAPDRSIMLNEGSGHDEMHTAVSLPENTSVSSTKNSSTNSSKSVNLPTVSADKSAMGSSGAHWQIGMRLAILAFFTVASILYFKRMNE